MVAAHQHKRYNAAMASPLEDALHQLRLNPRFAQRITAWRHFPARPGRHTPAPPGLEQQLLGVLHRRGLEQLYAHQTQAIAAALRGEDLAVVTSAASGKTLCYNLPVLNALLRGSPASLDHLEERSDGLFGPVNYYAGDEAPDWPEGGCDAR